MGASMRVGWLPLFLEFILRKVGSREGKLISFQGAGGKEASWAKEAALEAKISLLPPMLSLHLSLTTSTLGGNYFILHKFLKRKLF